MVSIVGDPAIVVGLDLNLHTETLLVMPGMVRRAFDHASVASSDLAQPDCGERGLIVAAVSILNWPKRIADISLVFCGSQPNGLQFGFYCSIILVA